MTGGRLSRPRPRWITAPAWRSAGQQPFGGPHQPPECRLVLLILTGDARSGDLAGWRRGRAVLLGVDRKIAKTRVAWQVRALPGGDGTGKSGLRQAGRLSRRNLRRPARAGDFAQALGVVRTVLIRDLAALERSGLPVARPAAVFYAVEPPLADAVTAEEYEQLAGATSVTWVVPERSARLMSAFFAVGGSRVLTDHDAVTDEVAHLLRSDPGGSPGTPVT